MKRTSPSPSWPVGLYFASTIRRAGCLVIVANLLLSGVQLWAEPPAKASKSAPSLGRVVESANGWTYVNGQWLHPEGYRFVNNRIVRTTAKPGRPSPRPPGKLALENAAMLASRSKPVSRDDA